VGGLETLPMALVMTAAALLLARDDGGSAPLAGILLALLPWIRPEGLALAGALVFFSEIGGLLDRGRRGATLRRLLWLALLPLASQAALQGLRWGLYGNVVPNSVLYKTGTGRTTGVVTIRFVVEHAIYFALAALALVRLPGRARLLVAPAAVYLLASITFLNSVNQFSRLLLPTLPLWALLAGAALQPWGADRRGRTRLVAGVTAIALVMVVVMPASLPTAYATSRRYMACRHPARHEAGLWLRQRLGDADVYAIADAGVVPFYADGTAHDMFGLNEAYLQDTGPVPNAVRGPQALDLQPRFLVLSSEEPDRLRPHYAVERALRRDDRFSAYELGAVTGPLTYRLRTLGGTETRECDYFMHIFEAP